MKRPVPRAVEVTVALAVLGGIAGLIGVLFMLVNASDHAEHLQRQHPERSRTSWLVASYVVACMGAALSTLTLVAARALRHGRRWSWIALIVLAAVGLAGSLGRTSAAYLVWAASDAAMLVLLLTPSVRDFAGGRRVSPPVGSVPRS